MTLKTSLLITGDTSVARKAVEELAASNRALGASGKEAASGLAAQERAEIEAAAAGKAMAAAQAAVADQLHQAQAAAAGYQAALRDQTTTVAALQGANAKLTTDLRASQAAAAGLEAQLALTKASAAGAAGSLDGLTSELAGVRGELATLQAANGQLAGDLQRAQAGGAALAGELADVRQAAAGTGAELTRLRQDAVGTAAEVQRLGTANVALQGDLREAKVEAGALAGQLKETQQALAAMAGRVDVLETRLKGSNKALREGGADAERHAAGVRNLGQQFGDMAVMIQGGISPARAFATQAGQMGYAMSELGGKAGAVGRFLVGPLGIALTVATAALAPLVEELLKGGDAAADLLDSTEKAARAADSYGNAQSMLGKAVDLTTGKLKTQNLALIETIKLQARAGILKAQQDQRDAREDLKTVGAPGFVEGAVTAGNRVRGPAGVVALAGLIGTTTGAIDTGYNADLAKIASQFSAGRLTQADAQRRIDQLGLGEERSIREGLRLSALATAQSDERANRDALTAIAGGGLSVGLRQEKRTPKGRDKTAAANALAEFGRDAGDKIAGIVGEFDRVPGVIDKAGAKVRELDDLIGDLNQRKPEGFAKLVDAAEAAKVTVQSGLIRALAEGFDKPKTMADKAAVAFGDLDAVIADLQQRKPPGFEQLIAEAREAKSAIEAGLNRPLDDFLQQQRETYAVNELIIRGRLVEADALRTIVAIEKQRGPLSEQQRAEIVASTAALRQQERQLERVHERQRINLDALADMRDIARQTIFEGPQSIAKLPERLFASFKNYNADRIAEELFGELFRDLRDKVTGASKVDQATDTLVSAFREAATSATALSGSLASAAGVPAGGSGAVGGNTPGFGLTRDAAGAFASDLMSRGLAASAGSQASKTRDADDQGEIKVIARKRSEIYGDTIAGVLKKIGIGKDTAADIGKGAGRALAGAFEGQAAAGVAGMLGIKTSSTGAGIGGAIGGLTGLPGGAIVGGLLGGIAGGLLKKTKSGGATIGDATTAATTSGNSSALQKAASGLAGSVQDTLAQIAEQLGGGLGSFGAITIGKRDNTYRVNATGSTSLKGKKGAVGFGDDEAGAIAYAVRIAIERGAVTGLSAAVQRAIASSTDINKSLKEALAVQDVEALLGGSLSEYQKAFRAFEAQAKERVRIATEYGFDVVAIEKRNADDRTRLAASLAQAQVGSLQALVSEMTSGSLFEGSALDRITALNDAIGKAKIDLDNNVEGAGDRLASLYEQRLGASRDAYASTSQYAADRSATIGEAQAAIARVNAQITQANQAKTDPALTTTNATLDEIADQNARLVSSAAATNELLKQIAASSGSFGGFNLAQLAIQ